MRFRVDLIIGCTTWPTRKKPNPPMHLGHDFEPTTTIWSGMGHKFWPKNSIQRRKNWPDSYVERVWAKKLPNVRFMLAFASQRNVEFFWPALNPVPEQVYFNMSSHMLDLVAYSKFWVARQFDCLAMALCIVISMWCNTKGETIRTTWEESLSFWLYFLCFM